MSSSKSANASADGAATGSSVRETFVLMSSLIYPRIPVRYLDLCAQILQRRHMDTVFEERAVQSLCAFPACGNTLSGKTGKFRISLARKEIYDAQYENKFCSQHCLQKARVFLGTLVAKPPQLVPSLRDVFGTESPNPFDFDDAKAQPPPQSQRSQTQAPRAKTVWAKTADLGVVERSATPARPSVNSASVELRENASPAAPDAQFPDAAQAVLIEGFVFPAHKQKLAKKVETLLQQQHKPKATGAKSGADDDGDDDDSLVVSDSDESDVSDAASDASSASFALSDCDDDEVVTLDELSLFSNLWRLLASWITHETHLVVAGEPVPAPPKPDASTEDAEARALRHRMTERRNAFTLMLTRPIPQAAQRVRLAADRYVMQKIGAVSSTFALRDAIDARNAHQWTCIATVLLLVAHDKHPSDVTSGALDHVAAFTKLEPSELAQLLALFYDRRQDNDVVVDTDTQPLEEISTSAARTTAADASIGEAKCRKCRRVKSKCICATRAASDRHSTFSVSDVDAMLQEALTLREEYEELLEA